MNKNDKARCVKSALALAMVAAFGSAQAAVDTSLISKDALVKASETVDCELENGEAAQCAKLVVKYLPDNLKIGPFCPDTVKEAGGIWQWDGDNPGLYRLNEAFLTMLHNQGYEFYDADGKVSITDVRTSRPQGKNSCLSASVDTSVEMTVLLPLNPVKAEKASSLGTVAKVGLALDGVPIFADAPSVLQTGHMPALDVCGGHVDPGGWYHWHATATDINNIFGAKQVDANCALAQKADALFAYAFDGYPMYGSVDSDGKVPTDLDECNGHVGPTANSSEATYHYHASLNFPNLPGCLSGVTVKNNFSTNAKQGIGAAGGPGGPNAAPGGHNQGLPPGFDKAAEALGVSYEDLSAAIINNGGRDLDLAAAAKALGVTETALKAALPRPPGH